MANTITLTDIANGRVFAGDLNPASVPVAGTYTASGAPPAIQAQLVSPNDINCVADINTLSDINANLSVVVTAWQTVVASPTGGTFAATLAVPQTKSWLQLQVRFADASAQSSGANLWGVGVVVLAIGQSNMAGLWNFTSLQPPPVDPLVSYYDCTPGGAGWTKVSASAPATLYSSASPGVLFGQWTGDGAIMLTAALRQATGYPVGLMLGAVGGSALDAAAATPATKYWLRQGGVSGNYPSDYIYQAVANAIAANGNDVSAITWLQGEQEIALGTVLAVQWQADLTILEQRLLALCPNRTAATLPFHVGVVGFASYGSAIVDGFRAAMIAIGSGGNGFQLGPCTYDLPMLNEAPNATQHHTPPGYVTLGARWAQQILYWLKPAGTLGTAPGTSPQITSSQDWGRYLVLNVTQPPGAQFLQPGTPAANLTGFTFSNDQFTTTLTPALVRSPPVGITQIGVVFTATEPLVELQHQDGQPASFFPVPSLSNVCYGGATPASYGYVWWFGVQAGLPLCHTAGIFSATNVPAFHGSPVFPSLTALGFDVVRTETWSSNVQENISGKQTAVSYWSSPKHNWELTINAMWSGGSSGQYFGGLPSGELQKLVSFFDIIAGRGTVFLFQDPDDCQVVNQLIGIGDGTTTQFQLVRTLGSDTENIIAPNFLTPGPTGIAPQLYLNGAPDNIGAVAIYGSTTPGLLSFPLGAPAAGTIITATFSYYWPARFDDDKMSFTKFMSQLWSAKKVTFTSVK